MNDDNAAFIPCYPPDVPPPSIDVRLSLDPCEIPPPVIEGSADDWQASFQDYEDGRRVHLYHHHPTHAVFAFTSVPDAKRKGKFNVVARFLYLCDGHPMITHEDITRLGRQALFLMPPEPVISRRSPPGLGTPRFRGPRITRK